MSTKYLLRYGGYQSYAAIAQIPFRKDADVNL